MIIADTGFFLALANRKDKHHLPAVKALKDLSEPLITTWPVVTETCHLLLNRLGNIAQIQFISSWGQGAFEVFDIPMENLETVLKLIKKYHALPMDLADASLVLLAEHLNDGRIFSTDKRDFHTYRWKNRKPFKNLLLGSE